MLVLDGVLHVCGLIILLEFNFFFFMGTLNLGLGLLSAFAIGQRAVFSEMKLKGRFANAKEFVFSLQLIGL